MSQMAAGEFKAKCLQVHYASGGHLKAIDAMAVSK